MAETCLQPFELVLTEPSISFDRQLGGDYAYIDVDTPYLADMMRQKGMGTAAIGQTAIHISNETVKVGEGYWLGDCTLETGNINICMGSVRGHQAAERQQAAAAGNAVQQVSDAAFASEVLAHEITHRADAAGMGVWAYRSEIDEYERRQIGRHIVPKIIEAVVYTGAAVGMEYAALRHGMSAPAAFAAAAVLLTGGFSRAGITAFKAIEKIRSGGGYLQQPDELRARAYAAAYRSEIIAGTATPVIQATSR